jgi:ubiquinone/menaquinone biosynthesis C-methylase UbiE
MINPFLSRLHDTELWADYMPRIPPGFYGLVGVGVPLIAISFWNFQDRMMAFTLFGVGVLAVLPVILMEAFVHRRRQLRFMIRNQILDTISWRGDEKVLDVGCGSGVLLNGVAQRLKGGNATGKAIGIDIWAAHGGGGNLNLLMKNARAEKVADQIEFKEMDARKMTFADATFDVVLSSGAMHHISHNREEFGQVVGEIVRVLKPGGQVVIWDIEHMVEACASHMTQAGLTCEVKKADRFLKYEMGILYARKN